MRFLAALAVGGLLAGCTVTNFSGVVGTGSVQTQERTGLAEFTGVRAGGGTRVTISIGATPSVQVRAQENILPIIETKVRGGVLEISSTESYSTTRGVEVTIVTAAIDMIDLSGGAQGEASGIAADTLEITLSGGAGLTAGGSCSDLKLDVSGGAQAHLSDLETTDATVSLSGGARGEVNASGRVTGDASGGAHLSVQGDASVNVDVSGGASLDT